MPVSSVPSLVQAGPHHLAFDAHTHIMGILNVTPDSFSDGGEFDAPRKAIARARAMIEEGAHIIDVGGESTRPGAAPVDADLELERVLPVIQEISPEVLVSVDTYKASVAAACLENGAHIINDISGFGFDPEMSEVAAQTQAPVVLMHIKGNPASMQSNPVYEDVIDAIKHYFSERIERGVASGCTEEQFILDPGIGFGKSVAHNYEILQRLGELHAFGRPILIGTSRKSLIGKVLNKPASERLFGTAATVALAIGSGAHIVRVHDVWQMVDVARVADRVRNPSG